MLGARLLLLIQAHAGPLTRDVVKDLMTNGRTPTFRRLNPADVETRVSALYYNLGDLGIGREMHCTTFDKDAAQGKSGTACWVRNYGINPLNGAPDFSGDPDRAMADLVNKANSFAAVCMVKFGSTLAEQGAAILMISSDMEEIINVSDRVAVMHEGEISGVLERGDCQEENIMQLAVGKKISAAKPAFSN